MPISTSVIRFELIHCDIPVAVTDSIDPAATLLAGFLNGSVGMSPFFVTEIFQVIERVLADDRSAQSLTLNLNDHTLTCSPMSCQIRTLYPPLADAVAEVETKELKQFIERWIAWIITAEARRSSSAE